MRDRFFKKLFPEEFRKSSDKENNQIVVAIKRELWTLNFNRNVKKLYYNPHSWKFTFCIVFQSILLHTGQRILHSLTTNKHVTLFVRT